MIVTLGGLNDITEFDPLGRKRVTKKDSDGCSDMASSSILMVMVALGDSGVRDKGESVATM